MSFKHFFKLSPLSAAIKAPSLGLLLAVGAQAHATPEPVGPGESKIIDAGEAVKDWALLAGSELTVNGATTGAIRGLGAQLRVNTGSTVERIVAQEGSNVTVANATVQTNSATAAAFELTDSVATITAAL